MLGMSVKSVPGCLVAMAPMLIGAPAALTPGFGPHDDVLAEVSVEPTPELAANVVAEDGAEPEDELLVLPMHIFAEIDQADTNFILRLWDYAPSAKRQLITTGYLKASHRELNDRTAERNPYHPHTRAVPVEAGKIEEYVLRLYPFAATIRPGHRLVAELSNDEPLIDEHNSLLPPDAFHLPVGQPVTHKIYRDAAHPSRLVLPFTTRPN